jgi:hypothetical protein
MRRIFAAVVAAALLLVAPIGRPAFAASSTPNSTVDWGNYTLTSKWLSGNQEHRCLDGDANPPLNTKASIKVQTWDCSDLYQQWWHLTETSNGSRVFYIQNVLRTNKCLDADAATLPLDGTVVQLWDCNSQLQQQWYIPWLTHSPELESGPIYANATSVGVLDADSSHGDIYNGSKVQIWRYSGAANQRWQFANAN